MEEDFDHDVDPDDGYHPDYKHLAFYEFESHHSMYILTSLAQEGSLLISSEDLVDMFSDDCLEQGYGYGSDEYLDLLEG